MKRINVNSTEITEITNNGNTVWTDFVSLILVTGHHSVTWIKTTFLNKLPSITFSFGDWWCQCAPVCEPFIFVFNPYLFKQNYVGHFWLGSGQFNFLFLFPDKDICVMGQQEPYNKLSLLIILESSILIKAVYTSGRFPFRINARNVCLVTKPTDHHSLHQITFFTTI